MKTLSTVILTLVIAVILCIGGVLSAIYFGAWDVSAEQKDGPVLAWLAETTRKHSIRARIGDIKPPGNLDDPQEVMDGFKHYREDCVECHRHPGKKETELSRGLNPEPPDFSKLKHAPDPKVLFWVIKHGIRMTAMPAWGPTTSDDTIWSLVAFVHKLPGMTPQQWQAMDQRAGPPGHEKNASPGRSDANK